MKVDSNSRESKIYTFEGFTLDASKRLVFDPDGVQLPLMPKGFEILHYLVVNSQRLVEKDELMSAVWPDTIVEENNLTQNISAIRKVLGEKHRENRFIATVPGRGYKFVAEAIPVSAPTASDVAPVVPEADSFAASEERNARNEPPAASTTSRRGWLIGLAGVVLVALVSIGFVYWKEGAAPGEIRSVAVLPFKPLSSDRRDESLELGMADALIMKLGSDERVVIRPLSSVRRFASLDQDPVEAGRAVNVDAVLDGSIQMANERIRVSLKLLRVADSKQLWSGQFDEKLTDIFDVQDSIAQRVATELNITLGKAPGRPLTNDIEAYRVYMRGNLHARRLVLSEVEKGIGYYEEAIRLDPQFALAYVDLANAYRALVLTSDYRPSEYMPKAREAARKAVEADGNLAEAWTSNAISDFWYEWDWPAAEQNHLRALELDPYSVQARLFYAHFLSNMGRHAEAIEQVRKARERDPVGLLTNAIEGQVLFFAGEDDAAAKVLSGTIDMEPNFWLAHLFITRAHLKDGQYDRAIASAQKAAELTSGNAEAVATMGYGFARAGRPADARRILAELQERSRSRYVPSYAIATIHAGLDEHNEALDLLEKAFAEKDSQMVFLKVEPKWDPLRREPRFVELMRKMKFE